MSWIETSTGNRISREAVISGSDHIMINGNCTVNPGVVLKGDVEVFSESESEPTTIQIGKYSYLHPNCQIVPPTVKDNKYGPVTIGAYCIIGTNTVIRSANIGNRVIVESDCELGNLSIVYDCCVIRKGAVVPPKMVIPPYSEVSGVPGVDFKVSELNNSYKKLIEGEAKELNLLG